MRFFNRLPAPDWFLERCQHWSERFARRKQTDPGAVFNWPSYKKIRLNHHLLPILKQQTDDHCSYCDFFPARLPDETIDHFLPKGDARSYHLAYTWENLYYACGHCQQAKKEMYEADLLRPDDPDYSFCWYFSYDYTNHTIEVNPSADALDQRRAEVTIRIFQFNHAGQVALRRRTFESSRVLHEAFLDLLPFRFMFNG